MSRVPLSNRSIWLTGATSGIGRALFHALLKDGNRLIITARNRDSLEELRQVAPTQVEVLVADIATPGAETAIASDLATRTDSLDTVILNAGGCEYIDIDDFDTNLIERIFQVNTLGMARCIEACLPLLKASRKQPHLVGISSAAAITGLPRAEAYGASKAAVTSMLESLSLDLDSRGVHVSVIHPGFVDTPLTRLNDFPMPFLMPASQAAGIIVNAIEGRKRNVAFPRRLIWPLKMMSILPASIRHRMGMRMVREGAPA